MSLKVLTAEANRRLSQLHTLEERNVVRRDFVKQAMTVLCDLMREVTDEQKIERYNFQIEYVQTYLNNMFEEYLSLDFSVDMGSEVPDMFWEDFLQTLLGTEAVSAMGDIEEIFEDADLRDY